LTSDAIDRGQSCLEIVGFGSGQPESEAGLWQVIQSPAVTR
jgi:hypothetical protein